MSRGDYNLVRKGFHSAQIETRFVHLDKNVIRETDSTLRFLVPPPMRVSGQLSLEKIKVWISSNELCWRSSLYSVRSVLINRSINPCCISLPG